MNQLSDDVVQNIIDTYVAEPISISDVANQFNVCNVTVSRILKRSNIPLYNKQQLSNKNLNVNYFHSVDSEVKAYLLGFLLTDGCIYYNSNSNTYKVSLQLKDSDKYIIELFKNQLNSSNVIVQDVRKRKTIVTCGYSCTITNNIVAKDLISLGVAVGKPNRTFPNIDIKLLPHLLRGIFDGDGCVTYRKNHNTYRARVNIVGYSSILIPIHDIYNSVLKLSKHSAKIDNQDNTLSALNIYRIDDILSFYHYVYDDAHYYLYRKKEKFEEFFKLRNM